MSRRNRRNRHQTNRVAPVADRTALDSRPQQATTRQVTASFSAFQGPLPPPEMLERYNHIVPNGAERILTMAESQLHHRQSLESSVVNGNVIAQKRGQVFAFVLGVIAIVGGIGLIAFDKSTQGLVAIITAFVTLAGVFIYGRMEQERERERRRRELDEAARQPRLPLEDSN